MNKSFFKRPLYNIAGKISKVMRDFQKRQDEKKIIAADESWNKLFKSNNFFEYNLNSKVKINLYKDSVLSRLIYEGFEKEETDFLEKTLTEGDIFVDIGTNIGLFSLLAAEIVGIDGRVLCFEPAPDTFSRLNENIILNDFKNIHINNIGLSNEPGELTFYVSNNGHDAWNSFAPSSDNKLESSIQVPVSTLDLELKDIDKSKIKLVKIDVEGWEKFVLNGGKDFFIEFSPVVMVEFTESNTFNAGYSVHEIYDIMQDLGYVWYTVKNKTLLLETKRLHYPYNNLIAIKESEKIPVKNIIGLK
ncbi:FkbM family methyltransferase [Flavobacterium sp. DGU38]|uniref:FkbM family methyltransferase n=1 Tax=Flavobacterium calami TaxID=3139144 RepID=A0ABU9IJN6_9FLAO